MSAAPALDEEIRRATMRDASLIAEILAEAFADDPVMLWTFGNSDVFRTVFLELARGVYLSRGFAHISTEGAAATLWLPAGASNELPFANELRLALAALRHGGVGAIGRARGAAADLADNHPQSPHYYLFAVGVRRAFQGRGRGGRILRAGLELADEEGAPAYLENSKPINRPLYERLGFEAKGEVRFDEDAPPLLRMLRPARGA